MLVLLVYLMQLNRVCASDLVLGQLREPFIFPLHKQLREGDRIVFEGTLDKDVGVQFDLINDDSGGFDNSVIDILHIVINEKYYNAGILVDTHIRGWLLGGEGRSKKYVPLNTTFTVEITVMRTSFNIIVYPVIDPTGDTVFSLVYPLNMPLVTATYIRLQNRHSSTKPPNMSTMKVERKNDSPQVYIPRYQHTDQLPYCADNFDLILAACDTVAKEKRSIYVQFNFEEEKCYAYDQKSYNALSHGLLYFELLPIFYSQCPCSYSNVPEEFAVLRLFEELTVNAEKTPVTVIFEDWSWRDDLVFTGNGDFKMEFFAIPKSSGTCDSPESKMVWNTARGTIRFRKVNITSEDFHLSILGDVPIKEYIDPVPIGSVIIDGKGTFHFERF